MSHTDFARLHPDKHTALDINKDKAGLIHKENSLVLDGGVLRQWAVVVCLLLCAALIGCDGGSNSPQKTSPQDLTDSEKETLALIRYSNGGSPGFHCTGEGESMACKCLLGSDDPLWTCEGMKEWCRLVVDQDDLRCPHGICECSRDSHATHIRTNSDNPSRNYELIDSQKLSSAASATEVNTIRSAPKIIQHVNGYKCAGDGTVVVCSCQVGDLSDEGTCVGFFELCEFISDRPVDCRTNGRCFCSLRWPANY